MNIKKYFKKSLIVLFTIFVCLIVLEIGLRLVGKIPSNMASGINEQWGDSYRMSKNLTKTLEYPAFSYTTHTNSYGFRDKKPGDKNLKNRSFYVFMGASDVFANGVDFEDSFVGILEDHLSKHNIDVLNMAIAGHYFKDQMELLNDFMQETNLVPSRLYFCLNGLHIPKFDRKNKEIIVKNGILLNKNNWRLTYIRTIIGSVSSAYSFFRDSFRRLQTKWFDFELKGDASEFIKIYSKENRIHHPDTLLQFKNYLDSLGNYCTDKGIKLVYVYLPIADSFTFNDIIKSLKLDPSSFDTEFYEKLMIDYCKENNYELINLKPEMLKYHLAGERLRFQLDPHYNHFTNKIIGNYLIEKISIDDNMTKLQDN